MAEYKRLTEVDFGERYQIKGVLGLGGLGVVYKAYDTILKIDVAIKTLQSQNDRQGLVRLQREAMAAGKLKNENIALVYDFGQTVEDAPYMVMELVSGFSLAQLIERHENKRVDYKVAVPIFEQICLGLEHAHKNGIIHRDLKPSNIMLVERENTNDVIDKYHVKLLDFGVAKIQSDQKVTTQGAVVGSPLYMSPEQSQGDDSTYQSDIYSFGCLMFETLCGVPPLTGNTIIETIWKHKNTAPPLVSEILPEELVPKGLVDLIDHCLRKKASDRPIDVQTIRQSLEQIIGKNSGVVPNLLEPLDKHKPAPIRLPDWSHKTMFKFVATTSVLGILSLFFVDRYFQNTSLSKNEKLNDTIAKKASEPINQDLSSLVGKSKKFEYITSHRETCAETIDNTLDEDFAELQGTYFVGLKVNQGNITGSGFKYINKMPLHKIELRSNTFDPKYFSDLLPIQTLTSLRVEKNKADANMLAQISKFENLEQLTIFSDLLEDKDFSILANLPKLKKLKLSGDRLTDNLPDYLSNFKKLETLDLENCKLMTEDLGSKICKIKTLKSLGLPCSQTKKSFESLKVLKLKYLDVSDLALDSAAFESLCSMKSLKTLHMSNIKIDAKDYGQLNRLKHLIELDLSSEKICNPALFVALVSMPVKQINLSKSELNPRMLNLLIDNGGLDKIDLQNCKKIDNRIVKEFQRVYEKRWNRLIEIESEKSEQSSLDQYKIDPAVFDVPR